MLYCRLSKVAGAKLTQGNAAITDLSDTNRPTKLAEKFSELYDNQWTDAFEELDNTFNNEEETIQALLKILQVLIFSRLAFIIFPSFSYYISIIR